MEYLNLKWFLLLKDQLYSLDYTLLFQLVTHSNLKICVCTDNGATNYIMYIYCVGIWGRSNDMRGQTEQDKHRF